MTIPSDEYREVQEAAARWFLRRQEGLTSQQEAEFQRWQDASPRHRQEFAALCQLWGAMDQVVARRRPSRRKAVVSATLALLMLGGWGLLHLPEQQDLITAYGEHKTLRLHDGSVLSLGGHTRVRVANRWNARQLVVEQGIVRIQVAANPRPLTVLAVGGVLRDIGTTFDVARTGAQVRVLVLEGQVAVTLGHAVEAALGTGQALRYAHGRVLAQGTIPADSYFDWQSRVWRFQQLPLADLLEEANRQSAQPLRLADPAMARLTLSGSVQSGDRASLLGMLTSLLPLQTKAQADGGILLVRKKND